MLEQVFSLADLWFRSVSENLLARRLSIKIRTALRRLHCMVTPIVPLLSETFLVEGAQGHCIHIALIEKARCNGHTLDRSKRIVLVRRVSGSDPVQPLDEVHVMRDSLATWHLWWRLRLHRRHLMSSYRLFPLGSLLRSQYFAHRLGLLMRVKLPTCISIDLILAALISFLTAKVHCICLMTLFRDSIHS